QLDNITPRAFIVQNAKHYNNLTDIKNQFHLSDFNIRNTILLEGKSSKEKVIISTADTADVVHYSNNKVVIDTNLRHDGYLVLLDAFYPGWKIYVDNKEAQIIKADLIYRAVKLSSGKHKVVFLFDPVLLKIGLAITIIGIILLTGLLFKYKEIKWN
ncbi:MAG: YfhO family protein, partial [Cyanobacteriota bacterium]